MQTRDPRVASKHDRRTRLLGIGGEDVFDLGGILSAIIGVLIVLPIAGFILRRTGMSPERPPAPPA